MADSCLLPLPLQGWPKTVILAAISILGKIYECTTSAHARNKKEEINSFPRNTCVSHGGLIKNLSSKWMEMGLAHLLGSTGQICSLTTGKSSQSSHPFLSGWKWKEGTAGCSFTRENQTSICCLHSIDSSFFACHKLLNYVLLLPNK